MKRLRFKSISKSVQKVLKRPVGSVVDKVKKLKTQIQSKVAEVKQQLRQQLRPPQQLELAGAGVGVRHIEDTGTVGRNTTTPSPKPSNSQPSQNGSNKKPAEDKGTGKFDPLSNPKIAKEIESNSDAVYGYSPKKGSPLDSFGVDWTNQEQVASARAKRMEYLKNMEQKKVKLESEVAKLQSEGMSIEEIARKMSEKRNLDSMKSYDSSNSEGLAAMKERNIQQYGREEGPTPEQLFEKYGSWEEVIYGSVRTSPAMDVLTGLYKE